MKEILHNKLDYSFRQNRQVKLFFILLLIFSFQFSISSQTLLLKAEAAFESQLPFNTEYIKSQKIKSITFDILDKKDLEVVEDKGLLNYYEFNLQGQLTRFYYTTIAKIIEKIYHSEAVYKRNRKISNGYSYTKNEYIYDTVSTTYFYDENFNLKLKRYNDGTFYESYYYTYYPDGKLEKEKRFKETNVSGNKTEFILGTQRIISEESYLYKESGKNQYKKTGLNDEGRPYKEIIYNYDDSKRLLSYNEQYTATWIRQESEFTYNKKGFLIAAHYKSNSNGNLDLARTYEYDNNDCLITEKQFKNGELQKELSYVTDSNKKLTSYIIRDKKNKSLRIVKLFYQFY